MAGERRGPARWWRQRSLRARLTIITSAGLALALAVSAVLLVNALRLSLVRGLDDSARQEAVEVAALIDQDRLPSPVPVAPGTVTIQVLDAQGRITDVSPGADRLVPMLAPAQAEEAARTGQGRMLDGPALGMPSLLRVVAVGAAHHQIVIAATSFAQVSDSLSTLAKALLIGTPLLFGLLALATWLVTGYTLRPIAALRRGAAEVTETGVPRDLPVPLARDEVRSLAVTLNDMLSRLADAQQRQRDLVSDTAHELRSPIASIRAQLEVALDHPDGLDWPETARDVHADTLRLARLAEDLLLLARLDEQHLRRRPTDLAAVCASVTARYASARVPVRADAAQPCAAGPYVVAGDPDALARLLVNLLDNAVRHAASQVSVTLRADGGWAELTVSDDGPGIPAEDAERAFGRFSRLDGARSRTAAGRTGEDGAGLGLAIVKSTAEAHGGSVSLGDAGPGLRAVVRLPLDDRFHDRERLATAGISKVVAIMVADGASRPTLGPPGRPFGSSVAHSSRAPRSPHRPRQPWTDGPDPRRPDALTTTSMFHRCRPSSIDVPSMPFGESWRGAGLRLRGQDEADVDSGARGTVAGAGAGGLGLRLLAGAEAVGWG